MVLVAEDGCYNMEPLLQSLSDRDFASFQKLIHQSAGIFLAPQKKALVAGRLLKRLRHYGFDSYKKYLDFVASEEGRTAGEYDLMIDIISTNKTNFFRESHHFHFLEREVLPQWTAFGGTPFRVWSAACSTGEEPYSLAITLAEYFAGRGRESFEVLATDINQTVLQEARNAIYSMDKLQEIPKEYISKYFLKGVRDRAGTIRVAGRIRQKVRFQRINLNEPFPRLPEMDVIFCRNAMIYFNTETRRAVISRLLGVLKRGGYIFIGHSETLNGLTDAVQTVAPTIYRKL